MADVREMSVYWRLKILGKHIWYRTAGHCDVNEGIAERLIGDSFVRVQCIGADGLLAIRRVVNKADIYLTKEDLMGANYEIWQSQLKTYEESIVTVEDLVRFCFDHPVGKSEDMDDIARLAARHRAKALLDIEVDGQAAAEEAEIQAIIDEGEDAE